MPQASQSDPWLDAEERLTRSGAPFELREEIIAGRATAAYAHRPASIFAILAKAASGGRKTLLILPDRRVTYDEALAEALSFAMSLRRHGLSHRGVRVGIAVRDRADWVTAFLGTLLAGAAPVLLPLDGDTGSGAAPSRGEDLIILEPHFSRGSVPSPNSVAFADLIGSTPQGEGWRERLAATLFQRSAELEEGRADEPAVIAFTSGSTRRPKAVALGQAGITCGLMNMMLASAMSRAKPGTELRRERPQPPCALVITPLPHVSAYTQLLMAMMGGGSLALPSAGTVDELAGLLQTQPITSISGADPAAARALIERLDAPSWANLRSWNVSGYRSGPKLIRHISQRLPKVAISSGYGLTETNGGLCAVAGESLLDQPRLVGKLPKAIDAEIRGGGGSEPGEIWVRGAVLMEGYLGGAETGFDSEGWFHTGDLGLMNDNRLLFVHDRAERSRPDLTEHVVLADLEAGLAEQAGVEEAVVLREPEQSGKLRIAISQGTGVIAADPLYGFLERSFGIPRDRMELAIVDYIPRSPAGKIHHQALAMLVDGERGAGVAPGLDPVSQSGRS